MASLEEFAAKNGGRRTVRWCDTLPDDVQAQIIAATDASISVIVKWLHSLGYDDASYGKVDTWRRAQRERPNTQ